MYADPKHIKKHPYKVSMSDEERQLVEVTARAAGEQPSAWIRQMFLEGLEGRLKVKDNAREAG